MKQGPMIADRPEPGEVEDFIPEAPADDDNPAESTVEPGQLSHEQTQRVNALRVARELVAPRSPFGSGALAGAVRELIWLAQYVLEGETA